MAKLTEADLVWNRACSEKSLRKLPGDRALVDLLYAHGYIMSGGVLDAVEMLKPKELTAAASGYEYFGLVRVSELLIRAREVLKVGEDLENSESELDEEYLKLSSDEVLTKRFRTEFKASPSDFAPLRDEDQV